MDEHTTFSPRIDRRLAGRWAAAVIVVIAVAMILRVITTSPGGNELPAATATTVIPVTTEPPFSEPMPTTTVPAPELDAWAVDDESDEACSPRDRGILNPDRSFASLAERECRPASGAAEEIDAPAAQDEESAAGPARFDVPDGWRVESSDRGTVMFAPERKKLVVGLVDPRNGYTVEDHLAGELQSLYDVGDVEDMLVSETTFHGFEAMRGDYVVTVNGNRMVGFTMMFHDDDGRRVTLIGKALSEPADDDANVAALDDIVETVTFS